MTQTVSTFPSVRLPSSSMGLPVEVTLIAQLGIGAGDALIHGAMARQRAHDTFVDALDEPSARIGDVDLAKGDATSLYTFSLGSGGHPFHRHAGHRVFTAISGSAGARLRFSTASSAQISANPDAFIDALRDVAIPPDCLFTVRFGGGTWHQFLPLHPRSTSPALFALSCHTNELGGDLPADVRALVEANSADIPTLTEVLPESIGQLLEQADPARIPMTELSLGAAPASLAGRVFTVLRRWVGPWRQRIGSLRPSAGFLRASSSGLGVSELDAPPDASLLRSQLDDGFDFQDSFRLTLPASVVGSADPVHLLAAVLEGFLQNRPHGVSRLMAVRNWLVKPLQLRTSPLGCPVSSLLSARSENVFAGKYPVLAQQVDTDGCGAQVILGADDRHLRFRTCVAATIAADGSAAVTLGTRVKTLNAFGRFYMRAIERVHRRHVAPTMLHYAARFAAQHRASDTVA
ncbi:MAG: DUF2867 domain-containing protein [Pseudomonadota bacterium]|nr:DUF2867 domain-containing protein [Pseudomonadota bacterium]